MSTGAAPPSAGRIVVVDVLRAFALFGIIITHASDGFLEGPQPWLNFMVFSGFDAAMLQAEKLLTFGKFYTLFSFLFGLSFAIQMRNAADKGRPFAGRFAWRLIVLLALALVHGAFFSGDVLIVYAILGLLLMLFRKLKTRTLVITALVLVFNLPGMLMAGFISYVAQKPEFASQQEQGAAQQMESAKRVYEIKKSGDVAALVKTNLAEGQVAKLGFLVITGRLWVTFGLFLLGLAAGRLDLFRDDPEHRKFFGKLLWRAAPIALITSVAMILWPSNIVPTTYPQLAGWIASSLQQVTLSAVYLAAVTLLFWRNPAGSVLRHLSPTGKLGLTTYVMQTMFGLLVFYGFGFGLLGEIGVAASIGLAVLFFAFQVLIARWWLTRFTMGPLEWLWRALTFFSWRPAAATASA
jgi:uncharacterized protein